MMRVVMVSSLDLKNWHDAGRKQSDLNVPLGVLSLGAVLRAAGHEVSLLDPNAEIAGNTLPPGPEFSATASARIAELQPEVIGISTMCNSYHIGLRLAEGCKRVMPGVPVVFGGPHASVVDASTLTHFPSVDFILRGEAEGTLPQFLEELSRTGNPSHTPGLSYRQAGRVVRNEGPDLLPDLDALPIPAYDLLSYSPAVSAAIDAGRGCPFRCTFCSSSTYWRRRFRLKSVERILAEMRYLRDNFDVKVFSFQHDLFTFRKDRIREFCRQLKAQGWQVQWSCSARVDTVDADLLGRMADAGCCGIFYGVETGSPRLQIEIQKRLSLRRVLPVIQETVSAGIAPTVSFICGFPTETRDDLRQTFSMLDQLLPQPCVQLQLHILGPEPGAPDYARYRDRLRYDGYYSDMAGTAYRMTEPGWFERYPEVFSGFYYYETDGLPRELVKGADLFVHAICSTLRKALPSLLRHTNGLWGLYEDWTSWCAQTRKGPGPGAEQSIDEFLMDFHNFVRTQVAVGAFSGLASEGVVDGIVEFLLRNYGDMPVRHVAPGQPIPGLATEVVGELNN